MTKLLEKQFKDSP